MVLKFQIYRYIISYLKNAKPELSHKDSQNIPLKDFNKDDLPFLCDQEY